MLRHVQSLLATPSSFHRDSYHHLHDALVCSVKGGHTKAAELLLSDDRVTDEYAGNLLCYAVEDNNPDMVALFLKRQDIHYRAVQSLITRSKSDTVLRLLIADSRVDVNYILAKEVVFFDNNMR